VSTLKAEERILEKSTVRIYFIWNELTPHWLAANIFSNGVISNVGDVKRDS